MFRQLYADQEMCYLAENTSDKHTSVFFHGTASHSAIHIPIKFKPSPWLAIEQLQWEMEAMCFD